MFPSVVVCLLIATAVMAHRIKSATCSNNRRAALVGSALALLLALFTIAAFWALIRYPTLASYRLDSPLGKGWDCVNNGAGGADVCLKESRK